MNIQERVKGIIVEQLGVEEDEVSPTASFVDDLGADSLDQVELVMAFEEEFKLEIGDEDAEKLKTVDDAVNYITNGIDAIISRRRAAGSVSAMLVSTNPGATAFTVIPREAISFAKDFTRPTIPALEAA